MTHEYTEEVGRRGFAVTQACFNEGELRDVEAAMSQPSVFRGRAGMRHALAIPAVADLARDPRLLQLAQSILGEAAFPFGATLFDKSPTANWLVVWHQDTALPIRERQNMPGWGPWSLKDGVTYAHAPASALEQVLSLRIHLDESLSANGPLRVLPGSHRSGVLSDDEIENLAHTSNACECLVERGGVLAMRPLLVHASSKTTNRDPRRVLHLEYAAVARFTDGIEIRH